jgi:hypothetical protein
MTTTDQQQAAATAAASNGQGPAPAAAAPCEDCATASERVMGIIGLIFAVGLAAIAIDLVSGGAVSRFAASLFGRAEGDGGQPVAG